VGSSASLGRCCRAGGRGALNSSSVEHHAWAQNDGLKLALGIHRVLIASWGCRPAANAGSASGCGSVLEKQPQVACILLALAVLPWSG